ncbi:MAG: hypothetical protein IJT36_01715 [Alphaproteobacteria bacterium]|nr:hypothetical protein [Alphaproteobacteria bacterium]
MAKELTMLEILHNVEDELKRARPLLTERDDYGTDTLTDTDVLVSDIDADLDRISDAQDQITRVIKIALDIGYLACLNDMTSIACSKQDVYEKILAEAAAYRNEGNIAYKIVAEIRKKKVK